MTKIIVIDERMKETTIMGFDPAKEGGDTTAIARMKQGVCDAMGVPRNMLGNNIWETNKGDRFFSDELLAKATMSRSEFEAKYLQQFVNNDVPETDITWDKLMDFQVEVCSSLHHFRVGVYAEKTLTNLPHYDSRLCDTLLGYPVKVDERMKETTIMGFDQFNTPLFAIEVQK